LLSTLRPRPHPHRRINDIQASILTLRLLAVRTKKASLETQPTSTSRRLDLGDGAGYAPFVRVAFKEWAVVVDALLRGEQAVIVRKGGLREGPGGFHIEHPEFLLFPTLFHQQRESVTPAAQARYDELAPHFPPPETLRIEGFARVIEWRRLASLASVWQLRGQHIWRDDVITERFDWGRDKHIYALAVRVFRLDSMVKLPMRPAYGGCKSWVQLAEEVSLAGARPVLAEAAFAAKLESFQKALGPLS
jgi:hypothetical protein